MENLGFAALCVLALLVGYLLGDLIVRAPAPPADSVKPQIDQSTSASGVTVGHLIREP